VEAVLEPFVDGSSGEGAGVDAAALLAGANTLYLCAPAHDQRRLAPLFASVVHEVVDHVYDRVAAARRPLDRPLLVVLDEAANLAPLPDLDVLVSTAAGHGIVLVTVWHDLAQLSARYGPRATTVVNNHRARLFLPGIADLSTLEYASQLVGEEEVDLSSVTEGTGSASTTRSPTRRPLAPPAGLRRTRSGEALLVYGNLPPARLRLRPWFGDAHLRRLAAPGGTGAATGVADGG
jgi:type IV secretion system protein VirD4